MPFIHLHNHSDYSLLDGACKIKDLLKCASEQKMEALAITDHGNMFGTINFYRAAKKQGIKPIIGVEAYVAPRSRKEKSKTDRSDNSYHLILLVKNLTGYRNLLKLVSIGYLEGFYYRPRIDHEVLKEYHDGIIAMSACLQGEVAQAIVKGNIELAKQKAESYRDIFGDDFYLEMQNHEIPDEKIAAEGVQYLSKELSIPLVITNDIHYMRKEHHKPHDALVCIQTGKELDDPDRLKIETEELYFKSEQEMRELFTSHQEALDITKEIANKCDLQLEFGKTYLPKYEIPSDHEADNLEDYLKQVARQNLEKRYPEITPEIEERFNFELEVIHKMGYPGYFLIVKDFIDFARSQGIPVGPGRGSAAGSIISYVLGITNIDPLKYGLLFERFLNPERVSLPDIDIDFCYERREEVIDYVRKKYGDKNVTQIITFGTMMARAVIRDVGRVLKLKYSDVDQIAKMIPFGNTIDEAYKNVKEFRDIFNSNDERFQQLLEYSKALEGVARHASTHAAGVVIAPEELTNFVPLFVSNTGDVTTQYDMNCIEDIGLLKMDFLGLRTLTVLAKIVRMLRGRDVEIDLDQIPLDDKETYELFGKGETTGIFQFESGGMRDYLMKLKPTKIDDLIAMNALYRPGPMKMIDDYIARSHGKKEIEYLHPLLESVLKETYGIIVYQEQVMQIVSVLGGFTLGEADILRKAMGKKEMDLLKKQEAKFTEGAKQKGISEKLAQKIFDLIIEFGNYGFNKSHAVCYSVVAYQTAYLKTHYPAEFMASTLTSEMSNSDRIMVLIDECRRMGLDILPPCVNDSLADFTIDGKSIRFGLAAVKNVGKGSIESIIRARKKHGAFTNIYQFLQNLDLRAVNKKVMESLAKAGAMDCLQGSRSQQFYNIENAITFAQNTQSEYQRGQFSMFDAANNGGKSVLNRFPELIEADEWSQSQQLTFERELLGFYVSGHPLNKFQDEVEAFSTIHLNKLNALSDGCAVKIGCIITNIKTIFDKSNRKMAFATIEDFTGSVEMLVFSSIYEKIGSLVQPDSLILVTGKISTQENKEPTIICEELLLLAETREKFTKNVCMNLSLNGLTNKKLDRIKKLVNEHKGKCKFLIHVTNGDTREYIIQSQKYRVAPGNDLLVNLKEIVGAENVWIEG